MQDSANLETLQCGSSGPCNCDAKFKVHPTERQDGSRDTPSITDIGGLFWALSEQCGEEVSAKITTWKLEW